MVTQSRRRGLSRRLLALGLALLLAAATLGAAWVHADPARADRRAQEATPVPLIFPTSTASPAASGTPTRTPTQGASGAFVEANSEATNVRAGPDINEARLGQIGPGTQYPILGRRFNWYLIAYPNAPGGEAWVYNEVVTVTGDAATIVEMELGDIPTSDPLLSAADDTAEAITQTPGIAFTLTAQSFITPTGVFTAAPGAESTLAPGQSLPTYTFPPYSPTPVAVPRANPTPVSQSGLPPIVPILALGALGLMGLLVAVLRRL
jgi:hypothetical protein